ncbi:MAG: hypothetical protein IPN69_08885 [Acidobacteria bacterium]|nr:hypothetical protein [Acidobacteriota bacterium]
MGRSFSKALIEGFPDLRFQGFQNSRHQDFRIQIRNPKSSHKFPDFTALNAALPPGCAERLCLSGTGYLSTRLRRQLANCGKAAGLR